MFEDLSFEDTRQLFHRSLVLFDKEPAFIYDIDAEKKLCFYNPKEDPNKAELKRAQAIDKRFDFSPVPLGFINVEGHAFFLSRAPVRQYKVGLSNESLNVFSLPNSSLDAGGRASRVENKFIVDTIKGKYPSLEEAVKLLKDKKSTSVGIERHFALDRDFQLFYKNKPVGIYDVKRADLVLMGSKEHIKILWEDYVNAQQSDR